MGEKHNLPSHSGLILILDITLSLLASLFAVLLARWAMETFFEFSTHVLWYLLASAVVSAFSFVVLGTHNIVIRYVTMVSCGRYFTASFLKAVMLSALLLVGILHFGTDSMEVAIIVSDFLMTVSLLVLSRIFIMTIQEDRANDVGKNVDRLPVAIYGLSEKSVSMLMRFAQSDHYMVVGILTRDKRSNKQIVGGFRVFSFEGESELVSLKSKLGFEGIIFSSVTGNESEMSALLSMCVKNAIHVLTAPRVEEMDYGGYSQHTIQNFSKENSYIPDGMSGFERAFKRLVDFILSGILLLVFSPLFLICYVAVRLGDGGPAIYAQERIGRFGRPFRIYKFRSMRMDAESMGPALYSGDDDPRLTSVGKFLRIHHLDELPQLWNVFCGDMAFIGYRPERQFYIDQIMEQDPRYYYLYQIRPGVTSYATLKNGYTDTLEKMLRRLEYDLYYLRHRSFWFDCSILLQTFMSIVFGKKF